MSKNVNVNAPELCKSNLPLISALPFVSLQSKTDFNKNQTKLTLKESINSILMCQKV